VLRIKENFVVDKGGHALGVLIDMKSYRKLLEELEELEDIRAYDEAKAMGGASLSFEQGIKNVERSRQK